MKFSEPLSAKQIGELIDAEVLGDEEQAFQGMNEIHKVESGDIMFVDVPKYFKKALSSAATGIILNEKIDVPDGKVLFVVDHPFEAYERLGARYYQFEPLNTSIHHTARIHPSAQLESGVAIAKDVRIGANTIIQANCYIGSKTEIGDNVWIQPNSTIGSEAFYYKREEGQYRKWTSLGKVVIEDDVVVGANCTIDKGVSGITRIGEGTRMDNLVHIGHGVVVGKNCLISGQAGIGGKTILEDNVILYGQAGIKNSLHIGEGAVVMVKTGVMKDLEGGKSYFGIPSDEVRDRMKQIVTLRNLAKGK
jgi:UDP-3-O-[3-hydroxymyristoyl] glucosamine N-acyltransferase